MYSAYKLSKHGIHACIQVYSIDALLSPFWTSSIILLVSNCIQVSQEIGKVVWYSSLFRILQFDQPRQSQQFVVTHTVKGLSIVSDTEIDIFLRLSCFLHDPANGGNLASCSFTSLKLSLYIWNFLVHLLWKPNLKDFEQKLASMGNEIKCMVVWAFSGKEGYLVFCPSLGLEWKLISNIRWGLLISLNLINFMQRWAQ